MKRNRNMKEEQKQSDIEKENNLEPAENLQSDENAVNNENPFIEEDADLQWKSEMEEKFEAANDKYIRLAAEFENYRRRTAKERLDLIGSAGEDIIKGFLTVLDDCERAIVVLKDSDDSDAAKEGTELIYNKILTYLKSKGLSLIDAMGAQFDTDYHEAVAQLPVQDKKQKNKVVDIIQQGYTLNGKVIRYAKVVIGI